MDKEYIEAGFENNIILFRWDITDICQYQCSYCYATNNELVSYNIEKHNTIVKLVLNKLNTTTEDFEIEIIGGEPTLFENLEMVIENLNENKFCKKILLISNFHKENEYFIKLAKFKKLFFTFSYHAEYASKFIKKLSDLGNFIEKNKITVTVNIHDNERFENQINEVIDFVDSSEYVLDINFLFDTESYKVNYKKEIVEKLSRKENFQIPHKYKENEKIYDIDVYYRTAFDFNYKGWTCEPLIFRINVFGEITNCCSKKQFLRLNDIRKKITCPYEKCDCFKKQIYKKVKNG